MKKLFSAFAALLMGAAAMVSCNDSNDNGGGGERAPRTSIPG